MHAIIIPDLTGTWPTAGRYARSASGQLYVVASIDSVPLHDYPGRGQYVLATVDYVDEAACYEDDIHPAEVRLQGNS